MRQHFLESRHKYTRRVVCECGKLFSGGSSSGYRYHRCFFLYCFVFVLDEKDQDLYQCCGSMTFGCRSGSADPCFCLMDAKLLFRIRNTAGDCCHVPDPDLDLRIKGAKNWRFMRISVSVPSSDPDPQHWLL
jgi:hypothetical protein